MRVISLLPSATEVLCAVGGRRLLVGRSHECDFPAGLAALPVLTGQVHAFESSRQMNDAVSASLAAGEGLYTVDGAALGALRPELVLTQSLCSVCSVDLAVVEAIVAGLDDDTPPQILSLNPHSLRNVLDDMLRVGEAAGLAGGAAGAVAALERRIQRCLDVTQAARLTSDTEPPPKVAFVEWLDPIFVGGHWTPALIEMAGGCHPMNPARSSSSGAADPSAAAAGKSFAVPREQLEGADPDVIIICPCGLDLEATSAEATTMFQSEWWRSLRAVRGGQVVLVDGNQMFNRPGPRLVDALEFLTGLLNNRPELIPEDFPWQRWSPAAAAAAAIATADSGTQGAADDGSGAAAGPHPPLARDIEDAYKAAVACGSATYTDPSTGYSVFTDLQLRERGFCCGNRCRHCPYGHYNVDTSLRGPRLNRITAPARMGPGRFQPGQTNVTFLVWTGGLECHMAMMALASQGVRQQDIVLLVGASPPGQAQHAWGSACLPLHDVIEQAKRLRVQAVVVPLETGVWRGPADAACRQVVTQARQLMQVPAPSLAYAVPSLPRCAGKQEAQQAPPDRPATWEDLMLAERSFSASRPPALQAVSGSAAAALVSSESADAPGAMLPWHYRPVPADGEQCESPPRPFSVTVEGVAGGERGGARVDEDAPEAVLTTELVASLLDGSLATAVRYHRD